MDRCVLVQFVLPCVWSGSQVEHDPLHRSVKAYGALSFAHRRSRIMVNLAAFYDGPADKDVRETWVEDSLRRCARATRAPT